MTWPHFIIYAVVIGVGLPATLRNPTAGALVVNWTVGEFAWMITANDLPLKVYFMADVAVITVICIKAIRREDCRIYPTLREQMICLGRALTIWDRWIAASYIFVVWPVYILEMDARTKWFLLWSLVIAQFLLAAGEAIYSMLGYTNGRVTPNRPPGGSGLAYARGGGSG